MHEKTQGRLQLKVFTFTLGVYYSIMYVYDCAYILKSGKDQTGIVSNPIKIVVWNQHASFALSDDAHSVISLKSVSPCENKGKNHCSEFFVPGRKI